MVRSFGRSGLTNRSPASAVATAAARPLTVAMLRPAMTSGLTSIGGIPGSRLL